MMATIQPQPAQEDSGMTPDQEAALQRFSLACAHALYDKDGSVAKNIARAIRSNQNAAQSLADMAYSLTAMLDERSGGLIEDELLGPAAADVLGQLVEIAHAAKVEVSGVVVATAVQIMLRRFMEETGANPDEINQVMSSATPDQVGKMIDGGA